MYYGTGLNLTTTLLQHFGEIMLNIYIINTLCSFFSFMLLTKHTCFTSQELYGTVLYVSANNYNSSGLFHLPISAAVSGVPVYI